MIKDIISNKKKRAEILVVEDSPTQALKLKYLLEEHSFSYVWAKNGLEALNKTKENKPDLIVSDIVMPKMDGYELCRNLKTDNTLKDIPVILLTALTGTENIIEGLDVNADFYITKPYKENFLLSKINLLLSKKTAEQSDVVEELEIILDGKTHRISADRKQMLNLLLSTHENLVLQNQTLTQTQEALRKLNEKLEEKVREKTAHLLTEISERKQTERERKKLESQFLQAQKMEAIGTLAGGIAHDFNNILAAIIGYAELAMLEVPDGSKVKQDIMEAFKAGNRAKNLVQQILTFSRMGKQERMPIQMRSIVKESIKLLRASLPTTIEIRQNIESDLATIEADPTQMQQITMNLCTNAYHAMMKEGGILEINLSEIELDSHAASQYTDLSPGKYVTLTVSDTGYGMDKEVMKRIFEPYFTTKENGMGTGLGLSVVHGIVKNHSGVITAHSEPGKGSAFHVYIPAIQREAIEEKDEMEPLPTGTEHILFIDDEPALVDMVRQILERLRYNVDTRTSSLEALELFKALPDRFDLVITDMTMPQMTGDRLAKKLMQIRPDIPIILCTGFSQRISEERAKEMGIKAFAMKPLLIRDLAKTVRKVLDPALSKR